MNDVDAAREIERFTPPPADQLLRAQADVMNWAYAEEQGWTAEERRRAQLGHEAIQACTRGHFKGRSNSVALGY